MGVVDSKSAVTPWVLFDSNQDRLDLWNDVQHVSELPWQMVFLNGLFHNGNGSTFTPCHAIAIVKKAILLHKMATVRFFVNTAVYV